MDATSYLVFVHIHPIPEDHEAVRVEKALAVVAQELLPGFDIEVTAAWVTGFEVVSMGDLDSLPTYTST